MSRTYTSGSCSVDGFRSGRGPGRGAGRACRSRDRSCRAGTGPELLRGHGGDVLELGRRHDVDLFVAEAGIGGRRDATAVLDRADTLMVVTNVGLDHTDVPGSTVEEIAAEKVAVFA